MNTLARASCQPTRSRRFHGADSPIWRFCPGFGRIRGKRLHCKPILGTLLVLGCPGGGGPGRRPRPGPPGGCWVLVRRPPQFRQALGDVDVQVLDVDVELLRGFQSGRSLAR